MFWTGCEVADLNQRQKTIRMNHRNKIQSLVSPTDDPGDAPDCMCESGPCTCEYGRMCHAAPTAQKYGFSPEPMLDLAFLVRPKPSKSMPATKYGQQRENRKSHPGGPEKMSKNKKNWGKVRNFQSLIRETAKRHGALHIGAHLVAKGVLGHMRQIHPISTCTEGNSANFSKYGFSPEPTLDYVQIVTRIPLETSRTPQGHQPCIFR